MLHTCIEYVSADPLSTYIVYHPADVRWHVLNDTMSQYYLCYYRIFGLNALRRKQQHTEIMDALLSRAHAFHQVSRCSGSQQASVKGASKYMYAASMLMSENHQITIQIDHTSQLCN